MKGTVLSLWVQAVRAKSDVPNRAVEPTGLQTIASSVVTSPVKVLTPQLVSAYHSTSQQPHFRTYLAGNGLRMGDCLTQVQPPAPKQLRHARHLQAKEQAERRFSEHPTAPAGAFAFDDERFLHLLMEPSTLGPKGLDVERIYFEGMQWLKDETMRKIGDFCPSLRLLNLDRCDQLTDDALINIARKCSLLSFLNVSGCHKVTGRAVKEVIKRCPQLCVLVLHGLPRLDPEGCAFEYLSSCRNLYAIDLSYCNQLTDTALALLARHCPSLAMLDISGCHQIGNVGVASIGGRCSALQVLRMKMCRQPKLTKEGLLKLSFAPRNLKELDLSGVDQLTDDILTQILHNIRGLRSLSIAGCTELTDKAVLAVAKYCKQMRVLNLSSCRNIDLSSTMALIHDVKVLRTLIVSESSISNAETVILQSLRPSCQVIRNQYRQPRPTTIYTSYAEPKKKKGSGKGKKGKGKK